MKNMTFYQFKQTYENWKSSGLSVLNYCRNTGLLSAYIIIRIQAFGMQYFYNYHHTLYKVCSINYNSFLYFLS